MQNSSNKTKNITLYDPELYPFEVPQLSDWVFVKKKGELKSDIVVAYKQFANLTPTERRKSIIYQKTINSKAKYPFAKRDPSINLEEQIFNIECDITMPSVAPFSTKQGISVFEKPEKTQKVFIKNYIGSGCSPFRKFTVIYKAFGDLSKNEKRSVLYYAKMQISNQKIKHSFVKHDTQLDLKTQIKKLQDSVKKLNGNIRTKLAIVHLHVSSHQKVIKARFSNKSNYPSLPKQRKKIVGSSNHKSITSGNLLSNNISSQQRFKNRTLTASPRANLGLFPFAMHPGQRSSFPPEIGPIAPAQSQYQPKKQPHPTLRGNNRPTIVPHGFSRKRLVKVRQFSPNANEQPPAKKRKLPANSIFLKEIQKLPPLKIVNRPMSSRQLLNENVYLPNKPTPRKNNNAQLRPDLPKGHQKSPLPTKMFYRLPDLKSVEALIKSKGVPGVVMWTNSPALNIDEDSDLEYKK